MLAATTAFRYHDFGARNRIGSAGEPARRTIQSALIAPRVSPCQRQTCAFPQSLRSQRKTTNCRSDQALIGCEDGGIVAVRALGYPPASRLWRDTSPLTIISPMVAITEPAAGETAGEGAFAPFAVVDGDPSLGLILVCDHAESRLPQAYGSLGLPREALSRHIAYDPGARELTLALAAHLSAPAVLSRFSRLLIDPNRGRDDPTLIMRLSDRAVVPGNLGVDEGERARRIAGYYQPYDGAIRGRVEEALARGGVPVLVSVHSFTPVWRGRGRPWQVGILWDADPRLAVPLIAGLSAARRSGRRRQRALFGQPCRRHPLSPRDTPRPRPCADRAPPGPDRRRTRRRRMGGPARAAPRRAQSAARNA